MPTEAKTEAKTGAETKTGTDAGGGAGKTAGRSSRRRDLRHSLTIGLVAAVVVIALTLIGLFRVIDLRSFDLMSTFDPPPAASAEARAGAGADSTPDDPGIVIVAIDEASFAALQRQWPWPRDWHAMLIDRLRQAGAKTVALDIILADPGIDPRADAALANALHEDNVLAGDLAHSEDQNATSSEAVLPLASFLAQGAGIGIALIPQDEDGVLRRLPVSSGVSRLTGEIASDGTGARLTQPIQTLAAEVLWRSGIDPRLENIPAGALIQYLPRHAYRQVSYYQALDPAADLPPHLFAGKIVLVGLDFNTAADLQHPRPDSFATSDTASTGLVSAGVEVQATIIDNLLRGLYIGPLPPVVLYLVILLAALVSAVLLRRFEVARAIVVAVVGTLLLMAGSYAGLRYGRVWLPPAAPVAALLLTVIARTGRGFLQERAQRRWVTTAFGQYLSPALVERLAADPGRLQLGGETRELTILFCDIRGFTGISESMKDDPQRLTRLINRVLNSLTNAVLDQDGYIDKYIGDCVMALWNAPIEDADHAVKAVRAAQQMLLAIDRLNIDLVSEAREAGQSEMPVRIDIGIGINTGLCVVGNLGAEKRFNYSALGDAVNLASRLESATKEYAVDVVIGETTARLIGTTTALREIGTIRVKGKTEEVMAFTFGSQ